MKKKKAWVFLTPGGDFIVDSSGAIEIFLEKPEDYYNPFDKLTEVEITVTPLLNQSNNQ